MVFCLLLFGIAGIVGFFQYVQGFFSATISAILATIAAVVAMGWYEQVAPFLFGAKIYDQAASISMVLIFAVVYIIPRLIIDSLVPGNVRVPFIVEKVGAGLMGLIAALMGTGIVAVAADALPFGPTVGMYSRFGTTDDKGKTYAGQGGQMKDTVNNDVLTADKISDDDASHVWLRQDDLVAGLIRKVSADSGSLANGNPFSTVHPDLLDELYAQRLGIQAGAKHSAVNTDKDQPVTLKGLYTPPRPILQVDGEQTTMHLAGYTPPPATVTVEPDQIVVVVRLGLVGKSLSDESDNLLRYSLSSIRLVAGQGDVSAPFKDYFPVAVLNDKGTAIAFRPDDFLISDMSVARTVDFVFAIDRDHVMSADETKPPFHLPAGSFVEFKRYGLIDLSGKLVAFGPPPNPDKTPIYTRPAVDATLAKTDGLWTGAEPVNESSSGGGSSGAAGGASASGGDNGAPSGGTVDANAGERPLGDSGLGYVEIRTSNKLAAPISANTSNDEATVQLDNGVGGELTHHQWAHLTVTMDTPMKTLGEPQSTVAQELAVDPNTTLVQVECSAPVSGSLSSMWSWGKRLSDFALADATGHTYPCVGVWATVQKGAEHYFIANYKNFDDKNHLQDVPAQKGRPVNVWLAFQVPTGTPISEIRFSANTAVDNLNFKAQ